MRLVALRIGFARMVLLVSYRPLARVSIKQKQLDSFELYLKPDIKGCG